MRYVAYEANGGKHRCTHAKCASASTGHSGGRRRGRAARLVDLEEHLVDADSPLAGNPRLGELVPMVQEKLGAFGEFDALAGSLLIDRDPDPVAWEKLKADENAPKVLDAAITMLGAIAQFSPDAIEGSLRSICDLLGLKPKNAFTPIRIAVTGSTVAPGLYESIAFLGRDEALARLQRARAAL